MLFEDIATELAFIFANCVREANRARLIEVLSLLVVHDRIQQMLHVFLRERWQEGFANRAFQLDHRRRSYL